MSDLYDVAREITDEVFGEGAYAEINRGNPNPDVQRAIGNTATLSEIQRSFVTRFMLDDRVIGVRISFEDRDARRLPFLDVEISPTCNLEFPAEFRGLPVRTRPGQKMIPAVT